MGVIEQLLSNEPYALSTDQKAAGFLDAMRAACTWHQHNPAFAEQMPASEVGDCQRIEDLPFLDVDAFKQCLQLSVPESEVVRIVESSGTSGNASQVGLDEITIGRQQRSLARILESYLGPDRKHFLVFDNKQAVAASGKRTSSRASGLRGMTLFAKSMQFLLSPELEPDAKLFDRALRKVPDDAEVCIWGFTWMLHAASKKLENEPELLGKLREKLSVAAKVVVLHVGGWKQLEQEKVSKPDFNQQLATTLGIDPKSILDVYGMTEHLGTVYLDDEYGFKSVSAYSDVIIRDVETLQPLGVGEVGRIQLLTPVPHSYPGVSILTTDLGRLEGIDDCPTGRRGKYFTFQGRGSA